ncbi:CO dehydrogenase maturation factor [Sporobacter termitidis DSM 10068]|uniref:CO dehydrogenase maturation factor n=1 Tax=Sporobacter termitidis DSM 10068 TaxID=1123282 RepID=A0A1M5Z2A2_9FIRM|nr:AAA family ATPase [Sporobacter termitidis]SHI18385.1 CO dehydrogenase maturation factor [Sporobacter termitidis DSM 10068]
MKPITIAVAGKGGTGKTTICGIIIDYLGKSGKGPILAVDADPNSNLNEVLGVEMPTTLGEIREKMQYKDAVDESLPPSMTKQEYTEFMFSGAMAEEDNYDLLVMGRTQGEGCYCYINGVLKAQIDKYKNGYSYIVVDNEAGLEHISRGILPHIDILLLVSDASRRGIQAVGRVATMVEELKLKPKVTKLIVNRAPGGVLDDGVKEEIGKQNLDLIGVVPQDETVYRYDADGKPSSTVPEESPVKTAMNEILKKLEL